MVTVYCRPLAFLNDVPAQYPCRVCHVQWGRHPLNPRAIQNHTSTAKRYGRGPHPLPGPTAEGEGEAYQTTWFSDDVNGLGLGPSHLG